MSLLKRKKAKEGGGKEEKKPERNERKRPVEEAVILHPAERKAQVLRVPERTEVVEGVRVFRHDGFPYRLLDSAGFVRTEGRWPFKQHRMVYYYHAGKPDPIFPHNPTTITAEDVYILDRMDLAEKGISSAFRAEKMGTKLGAWKWVIVFAALLPAVIGGLLIAMRYLGGG